MHGWHNRKTILLYYDSTVCIEYTHNNHPKLFLLKILYGYIPKNTTVNGNLIIGLTQKLLTTKTKDIPGAKKSVYRIKL